MSKLGFVPEQYGGTNFSRTLTGMKFPGHPLLSDIRTPVLLQDIDLEGHDDQWRLEKSA